MGRLTVAVAVGVLAFAVACTFPPLSNVVYHYYTQYHVMARIARLDTLNRDVIAGFAIRAAIDLNLFEIVNKRGQMMDAEIAASIGADLNGTRVLLEGLCALDLMAVDKTGLYSLTAPTANHLVKSGQPYLGAQIYLNADPSHAAGFFKLAEAVKKGRSVVPAQQDRDRHPQPLWTMFATQTIELSRPPARTIAKLVGPVANATEAKKAPLRVLDVACGSGAYGQAMLRAYPHAKVTFLDGPNVLKQAKANGDEEVGPEAMRRATFMPGDAFATDLKGPYDVIVVSHFYHMFDLAACAKITRRLHAALAPGGTLVIHDFIKGEGRPSVWEPNSFPRVFALTMLANTDGGGSYTEAEYRSVLREGGPFASVEVRSGAPGPTSFILASKA